MTEAKKTKPEAAEAPKAKTVELVALRAVYGLMIHPYTQARFDQSKATDHELDGWVKTQMDAGKIAFA